MNANDTYALSIKYVGKKKKRIEKPLVCVRLVGGLFNTLRDFCLKTSIHGFQHIAVPKRHPIERSIWVAITILAIYMVVGISMDQWQRYNENPTVVTLEKDFRNWKFPLPGVTECSSNKTDPEKAKNLIKTLWNLSPGDAKYDYYMSFVENVADSELTRLDAFQKYVDDPSLDLDLYEIAIQVVPEQTVKPTWVEPNNPKWVQVMTEAGVCHATNSIAMTDIIIRKSDKNVTSEFPVHCKYSSFSCYVTLEVSSCSKFYFHSPYDIADTGSQVSELCPLYNRNVAMSVMETVCGPGVRGLSVRRRRCLYTDEPGNSRTEAYSTNLCRRKCRNKIALKLCGCKPFYNRYEEGKPCGVSGMACLAEHRENFTSGMVCPCMPQCLDAVFQELSFEEVIWNKGVFVKRGSIRVTVQAPRERYTREIVFHFHDLVVSFGGAAGFFLGASFLSFVEVVYFFFEKLFSRCCVTESRGADSDSDEVYDHTKPQQLTLEQSRINELTMILENDLARNYTYGRLNGAFY